MTENDDSVHKAFRPEEHAPEPGPPRETSPEERDGVSDVDTTGATPLGVGESVNARAEDVAREAEESAGTRGASERPYGGGVTDAQGAPPE